MFVYHNKRRRLLSQREGVGPPRPPPTPALQVPSSYKAQFTPRLQLGVLCDTQLGSSDNNRNPTKNQFEISSAFFVPIQVLYQQNTKPRPVGKVRCLCLIHFVWEYKVTSFIISRYVPTYLSIGT